VLIASCGRIDAANRERESTPAPSRPSRGSTPTAADTGDWIRPGKDEASTRFSDLNQITRDSVKQLGPKVVFSTGFLRGHEAPPLVVNGTMYVITPFPNVLYALDLTKPGAPVKWKFEPKPLAAAQGVACCDVVNRGAVYADGAVFFNTLDNRTVAVDAATGKARWITKLGEINKGETMTRRHSSPRTKSSSATAAARWACAAGSRRFALTTDRSYGARTPPDPTATC